MKIRITRAGRVTRCLFGRYQEAFNSAPVEIEWWIAGVGNVIETEGVNGFFVRLDDVEYELVQD